MYKHNNKTIEVLDAIMGSGKTTGIIKWMNDNPQNKYLYVSPLLSEVVDRIPDECVALGFVSPNTNNHKTKSSHLLELLQEGSNIAFTHKLFTDLTYSHLKAIDDQGYVLVVDEEIDFIESYTGKDYGSADIVTLEKSGHVSVDEDNLGRVMWKWKEDTFEEDSVYSKLKRMCDLGMLHCAKRSRSMLVLHLPIALLKVTQRCIVMTYLFDGSIMSKFMELKGIDIIGFNEVVLIKTDAEVKETVDSLITINITPTIVKAQNLRMSSTWYQTDAKDDQLKTVASAIRSACRKGSKINTIYTLPKQTVLPDKKKPKIVVNGYAAKDCFLYCGTKATNEYSHVSNLIHAFNRYPVTSVKAYLTDYGFPLDDDHFALSELIQWVWRSAIRNGEPITLTIIPLRMRILFENWMNFG